MDIIAPRHRPTTLSAISRLLPFFSSVLVMVSSGSVISGWLFGAFINLFIDFSRVVNYINGYFFSFVMAQIGRPKRKGPASAKEFKRGKRIRYDHAEGHVPFDEGSARRELYTIQSETNNSWAARDHILDETRLSENIQLLRYQASGLEASVNAGSITQIDLNMAKKRLSALEQRKLNFDKIKSIVQRADQAIQDYFRSSLVAYTSSIEEALSNPHLADWEGFINRIAKLRCNHDVMTPLEHTDSAVLGGYVINPAGKDTGLRRFGLKLLLQAEPDEDGPLQGTPELILRLSKLAREYQALFPKKERTLVPGAFAKVRERVKREGLGIAWDLYKPLYDQKFHSLWAEDSSGPSPVFRYEGGTLAYTHSDHQRNPLAVVRTPTRNVLGTERLEELVSASSLANGDFLTGTGTVFRGKDENIARILFGLISKGMKIYPNEGGAEVQIQVGAGDERNRRKHSEPRPWSVEYLRNHEVKPSGEEFPCVIADGCRYVVFPYAQLGLAIMEPPMNNAGTYVVGLESFDAIPLLNRKTIRSLGKTGGFMTRIEHKQIPENYWKEKIDAILLKRAA